MCSGLPVSASTRSASAFVVVKTPRSDEKATFQGASSPFARRMASAATWYFFDGSSPVLNLVSREAGAENQIGSAPFWDGNSKIANSAVALPCASDFMPRIISSAPRNGFMPG